MKRILILGDLLNWRGRYIVDALAARWRAAGHRVEKRYTTRHLPDADVVFLHIDSTVVPDRYVDCLKDCPVVINRQVRDISKRRLSEQLLGPDDDYAGPVIVKTNANCGGIPETPRLRYLRDRYRKGIDWRHVAVLNADRYPIFAGKAEVPAAAWANPALVVERFLPEQADGLYYLRYWIFLGERGWAGRFGSRDPVVKFGKMATADQPVPVPDELKTWRRRLGFDYGRFDYVERDGRVILFDANKTVGGGHRMDEYRQRLDTLAAGIDDF